ncbi:MAG: T9SS type A sorting domain-containing protein [Ignavibacteriaceae bacterium]|nr:T9SS type A sorting domain-containing protein [Ignavibacteriaceae bacterium]
MKLFFLLIILPFMSFSTISFTQYNNWEYKTAMPTARTFLSYTVLDNNLYVIGGCQSTNATNKVEAYDPSSDTWSILNNLPAVRCYAMSCSFQNKIYVFGGGIGMWSNSSKSVYEFDAQMGNWTQKSDMPYEIGGSGIAVLENLIYIIGGANNSTSQPVSTVMAYDPVNETWSQKTDLPTARNMLSACTFDGKIYAFGGTTEDWENIFYKVVEVYDPSTNTWTQRADIPTGRWGLVTCLIDGKIYAIGGRAGTSSTINEVYDPVTDSWLIKTPMQQARTGLAGGMIENKIYITGGHEGPPVVFLSSCEEYVPDLSVVEEESDLLPEKIELLQNYPNPFNPSTKISWQLPVSSDVTLKVFDVLGNEIATLVNEYKPVGRNKIELNAASLPSGAYFYQLKTEEFIQTKKMILVK